jgi:hypothetical protein
MHLVHGWDEWQSFMNTIKIKSFINWWLGKLLASQEGFRSKELVKMIHFFSSQFSNFRV